MPSREHLVHGQFHGYLCTPHHVDLIHYAFIHGVDRH